MAVRQRASSKPLALTAETFEVTLRGQSGPSWPNQATVYLMDTSWGGHGQPEIGYAFAIYGESSNYRFVIYKIGPGGGELSNYNIGSTITDWHTYVVSRDATGNWTLTMDDVTQTPSFMNSDLSYTDFTYIGTFLYRNQSALDYVEVRVPCELQPPVADCGGPYVAQATSWGGAMVDLDGTGSSDPDGDAISYAWDLDLSFDSDSDGDPCNDVDSDEATPSVSCSIGQTDISLIVTNTYGVSSEADVTTITVSFITVGLDIKPGSFPNVINLGSNGVIPVAFLTDSLFDASMIDPASVNLRGQDLSDGIVKLRGKKDAPVPMSSLEDVDDDGDLDLVVHLVTEKLAEYGLEADCEIGALTYDGYVVSGMDSIYIVPQ